MTKEQRIKLEELIRELEVVTARASMILHPSETHSDKVEKEALDLTWTTFDKITDHLDAIQGVSSEEESN